MASDPTSRLARRCKESKLKQLIKYFHQPMAIDLNAITVTALLEAPREEQYRVLTQVYRELFFNDIKQWSTHAIDILEAIAANGYQEARLKIEVVLGYLHTCGLLLQQTFETQHRQELQCMTEDTQFGAQLAESIYDLSDQINKNISDLITVHTYYDALLKHRKENSVNLLNAEGDTKPYSDEELAKQKYYARCAEEEYVEYIRDQRAVLEGSYWGEAAPPPLEEDEDSAQLVMPLWLAGFAVT